MIHGAALDQVMNTLTQEARASLAAPTVIPGVHVSVLAKI